MVQSKRKGNRFELKVSKWFTRWSGFKFERVPMSGAWHSNRDATSDITCVDPKHQYKCILSVECKSYKDIKFEHVLLGNKSCDILKFWDQAIKDASRSHKIPILCMRYNSMPREEFFFVISASHLVLAFSSLMSCNYLTLNIPGEVLMVFKASDVINKTNYLEFHKELRKQTLSQK